MLLCLRAGTSQLFGHAPRGCLCTRQVVEKNGDIGARRFGGTIKSHAVLRQLVRAGIQLARDSAKLAGRLVAELHQVLGNHRQLGAAVVDPLGQDTEQAFERARFGPHLDYRTGETLGFLPPRAPEHDPAQAEKGERTGSQSEPLRYGRRRQRLVRECASSCPGDVAEPQRREDDESASQNLPAAGAVEFGLLLRLLPGVGVE